MVSLLPALLVLAAEFWEAKPYTKWTEQEVARVLVDSPWAKEVHIRFEGDIEERLRAQQAAPPPPPANVAGLSQTRGGGSGPIGSMVGRKVQHIPAGATVRVRWESAKPLREAIAATKKAPVTPEARHYELVIDKIPPYMETREPAYLRDVLLKITELKWDKEEPVRASDVAISANEDGLVVRLFFPRRADAKAGSVAELHTRVGVSRVKCAFRVKPMTIAGRLEL